MKNPMLGTVGGSEREDTGILAVETRKHVVGDAPALGD